jgi:HNH endonuclease
MITTTKVFHYKILKERLLADLNTFSSHPRLRVFYHKGTTCVTCGKIGTRLIQGEGGGRTHWDIYTDDLYPLTVDHIIPKSLGGSDDLDNLQPMCAGCNFKKGNGTKPFGKDVGFVPHGYIKCSTLDDINSLIWKQVWKRKPNGKNAKRKSVYMFGTVSRFEISPHTKTISAIIEEHPGFFFRLNKLFVPKEI